MYPYWSSSISDWSDDSGAGHSEGGDESDNDELKWGK
jgi:hypothetical protein